MSTKLGSRFAWMGIAALGLVAGASAVEFPETTVRVDTPLQLKAIVGIPGMRAEVAHPRAVYYWHDAASGRARATSTSRRTT